MTKAEELREALAGYFRFNPTAAENKDDWEVFNRVPSGDIAAHICDTLGITRDWVDRDGVLWEEYESKATAALTTLLEVAGR